MRHATSDSRFATSYETARRSLRGRLCVSCATLSVPPGAYDASPGRLPKGTPVFRFGSHSKTL